MARKKRKQKNDGRSRFAFLRLPAINLELPERVQGPIWGIAFIAAALVFLLSFLGNAGDGGNLLKRFSQAILGEGAILIPILLLLGGLVFLRSETESKRPIFFALILSFIGIAGMLGAAAGKTGKEGIIETAGWVGYGLAGPLFALFDFWVSEIIFVTILGVSLIILWNLLPHEEREEGDFKQTAQEKIKKIFEPKFNVHEVEEEPRVSTAMIESEAEPEKTKKPTKRREIEPSFAVSGDYKLPPTDLLEAEKGVPNAGDVKTYSAMIKKTLQNFGISVEMAEVNVGPAVTQYAFKPAEGVKLSRITALQNDLALALAAHPIRIEAPIAGKALVGVELPNTARTTVRLRSLLEDSQFQSSSAPLLLALGKDVSGKTMYADLAKMPHMLVAGATGSGKTIGLNNIILSLIYRNSPETLRFVLVDPKRVEFPVYNELPHLLTPVITDTQRTINVLKWMIKEMERRFTVLANVQMRDIKSYHALMEKKGKKGGEDGWESMPYIVAVLDELADLMAARGKEMEGMIVRLAQMARAVGIHLVLATQRPSVEVITGTIKANITARAAFQVASQIDSRTILDAAGAERLLGQGDMLFVSAEFNKPRRIQGAFVSDTEVKEIVEWIARENEHLKTEEISEDDLGHSAAQSLESSSFDSDDGDDDPLYEEAKRVVIESRKASASLLQRRLKVGYARAARLIDILEERGVIGPGEGAKPREVYGTAAGGYGEGFSDSDNEGDEEDNEWKNPKLGE